MGHIIINSFYEKNINYKLKNLVITYIYKQKRFGTFYSHNFQTSIITYNCMSAVILNIYLRAHLTKMQFIN